MIRKYHNHKPQTNPWHREEEPHNHHETPGRQTKQSNQLSLRAAGVTVNLVLKPYYEDYQSLLFYEELDKDEDIQEVWFWGSASRDFVSRAVQHEDDGTFVVFRPNGQIGELVLAIKHNGGMIYKTIYHRDGLFGYTEPLGFEDLTSALEAYNSSQVDAGTLRATLPRPEGEGSNSSEETEEDFTSITGLLRHLKNNVKRLREKTNELEDLKAEMKRTEHEIEGKMLSQEGFRKVRSIMEHQKKILEATRSRSSSPNLLKTKEFVENEETINLHLGELDSRLQSLDEEIEEKRDESRGFSKQHSSCTSAISKIEHLQERCRSHLDGQPQLLDFIEGLQIHNDDTELLYQDRATWFRDCSVKEVDRHLQDKLDGTFLVRPHKPPDTPYCVCVIWTPKSDITYRRYVNTRERRIQKFIVLNHNGFYGFDPSTCIFDTLDELIIAYSRIPFKVHDPKYGNLSLNYPALASQNKQS